MSPFLSLITPGVGQISLGLFARGLLWLGATVTLYYLLPVVGVAAHILCVIDASSQVDKISLRRR